MKTWPWFIGCRRTTESGLTTWHWWAYQHHARGSGSMTICKVEGFGVVLNVRKVETNRPFRTPSMCVAFEGETYMNLVVRECF